MKTTECTPATRSWQLFLVLTAGDSLPHWGSHHYCIRRLSLPEDHSPSQKSPSPPPKGLSCAPALSPSPAGGEQSLHHAASMWDINMSCLWTAAFDCGIEHSVPLLQASWRTNIFLNTFKTCYLCSPRKEESSGAPHSLLTLTELHFRDQSQAYPVQ